MIADLVIYQVNFYNISSYKFAGFAAVNYISLLVMHFRICEAY